MDAINIFKWIFKNKEINLEAFVRVLGLYTELLRKFLLEDKLDMINILLK